LIYKIKAEVDFNGRCETPVGDREGWDPTGQVR